MKCRPGYIEILVESFYSHEACHRDRIHIRPAPNQLYPQHLFVECSRKMTDNYPVGTSFRLCVCTKRKEDGRVHLYAHFSSPFEVIGK
jgi:hypothetical protein